ncbi:hypothetical protein D3C87_669850 [compost metagenome]
MIKKIVSALLITGGILISPSLFAQEKKDEKKEDKKDAAKAKADSIKAAPKQGYATLLKNPKKTAKGFVNIYQVKEKLYLEIPVSLLEKDMLLASTISETSDNLNGVVGSKPQMPIQVRFKKVDSTLLLTKIVKDAIAPESDLNLISALNKNSAGAIMEKFPVKAFNPKDSAMVIDVTDFFLNDNKALTPFGMFRMNVGGSLKSTESFKKDRSYLGEIKSFDDNATIKTHLSYEYTLQQANVIYAKDKPFSTVMTHTFLRLPDQPVRPRKSDSRVGVFYTGKYKFSNEVNKTEIIYYANRFNLVPKDAAAYKRGEKVEPVKPIVFYVDSDFPLAWRETVKGAINDWQLAFEAIGFKNAVIAMDYPKDDPSFDPDNLKYNCVRYSPTPVANAMGPSWVDPRSGEIINASVYVFHDIVKLLNNWMFVQIAPADKAVRSVTLPEQYKLDGIKYVIRHEIGHCLGFMHNFGASSSIPVESLRSPSFTKKYGTTYSIMDYARFNYVAQPGDKEKGVQLSPPTFGLYDYYATKWNYQWFDPKEVSVAKEEEVLAKMVADKAGDKKYRYGAQGKGLDPSSQSEDLGDDAVKASEYGIKNLKYIMTNLNKWVGREDKDFEYRVEIWDGVLSQLVRYINHVHANVGGIITNEKVVGDPQPLYEVVSREKQLNSLNFVIKLQEDLDWLENPDVLKNLPLMGTPSTLLRTQIAEVLMQTPNIVNLSSLKSKEKNPFTPEQAIDMMFDLAWKPAKENKVPTAAQIALQKAFLKTGIASSKLIPANRAAFTAVADHGLNSTHDCTLIHPDEKSFSKTGEINLMGRTSVSFNLAPSLESAYFVKLKELQNILEQAIKDTNDKKTSAHYQLMLSQLNRVLNQTVGG